MPEGSLGPSQVWESSPVALGKSLGGLRNTGRVCGCEGRNSIELASWIEPTERRVQRGKKGAPRGVPEDTDIFRGAWGAKRGSKGVNRVFPQSCREGGGVVRPQEESSFAPRPKRAWGAAGPPSRCPGGLDALGPLRCHLCSTCGRVKWCPCVPGVGTWGRGWGWHRS